MTLRPRSDWLKPALAILLPLMIVMVIGLAAPPQDSLATSDAGAAAAGYSAPLDPAPLNDTAPGTGTGTKTTAGATATDPPSASPASQTAAAGSAGPVVADADTAGPSIFNQDPGNGAVIGPMKVLGYDFSDPSGVMWPDAVHLFVDGKCSRTMPGTTDITAGSIRYTPSAPLTNGTHALRAMLCDNLFNCRLLNWSVSVDGVAPTADAVAPTGTLNTSSTTISAALSDGTGAGVNAGGVTVLLDGTDVSAGCAVTAASLSCNTGPLADGVHNVSLDIPDSVGNHGAAAWSFSVNAAAVGITGHQPAPAHWQASSTPLISVDFQPVGSAVIDLATVKLLVDGGEVTTSANISGDGLQFTPPPLAEGTHTVQVQVADSAGHTGMSNWAFQVDTAAPAIDNTGPGGVTFNGLPAITASFSDGGSGIAGSSIQILLDGIDQTGAATISGSGFTLIPDAVLPPGSHTVQVTAQDIAGNSLTRSWSFTVPSPPPVVPVIPAAPSSTTRLVTYWQSYAPLSYSTTGGGWQLSGLTASPSSYFIPWYDSQPAGSGHQTELAIANKGGGEAYVSVFVAGQEKWHGTIAEGAQDLRELTGVSGGPLKVVCPTGQPLDVSLKLTTGSTSSTVPAVPMEDLEPVWLLPWHDPKPADGAGTSSIAIANAGTQEAAVDIFMGDPSGPDALQGHYQIQAGTAVLADLRTAGGAVKVVCTNDQPIVVGQISRLGGSLSMLPATGFSRLDSRYRFEESNSGGQNGADWLMIGNGNDDESRVEILIDGQKLSDPDNQSNDFFLLGRGQARAIQLPGGAGSLEIECTSCSFGQGLTVARRWIDSQSISDWIGRPSPQQNDDRPAD